MKYASVTVKTPEMAADFTGRLIEVIREHGTIYWGIADEATARNLFFEEFPQYARMPATVKLYQ